MLDKDIRQAKEDIILIGKLLWEKDLITGLSGNISIRIDDETMLLTAHGTCLGLLQPEDILLMKISGEMLDKGEVSTENMLHSEIYKNYLDITAIIHTHTPFINGYFLENKKFTPRILESKVYLGEVDSVDQYTPAVTDIEPVIEKLETKSIVVLQNHGVVSIGKDLFECFLFTQSLEEAIKIDAISKLYKKPLSDEIISEENPDNISQLDMSEKKYQIFSKEQMDAIVEIVNEDSQMNELGNKTNMTMGLAVKLNETGQTYSFSFENGRITDVGNDENVEFLVSAPEKIWRAVFNREIDPFVATTQKKMDLRGDFAKISKWYAPCSRLFELWQRVPIE